MFIQRLLRNQLYVPGAFCEKCEKKQLTVDQLKKEGQE